MKRSKIPSRHSLQLQCLSDVTPPIGHRYPLVFSYKGLSRSRVCYSSVPLQIPQSILITMADNQETLDSFAAKITQQAKVIISYCSEHNLQTPSFGASNGAGYPDASSVQTARGKPKVSA